MNESFILIIRNGHYRVADKGLSSWLEFNYLIGRTIVLFGVTVVVLKMGFKVMSANQGCRDSAASYRYEM